MWMSYSMGIVVRNLSISTKVWGNGKLHWAALQRYLHVIS